MSVYEKFCKIREFNNKYVVHYDCNMLPINFNEWFCLDIDKIQLLLNNKIFYFGRKNTKISEKMCSVAI